MVELSKVLKQLADVGYKTTMFQRSEVKELCNVLHEDEEILQATNGYYEGGFSLLVATDHRLLLVDRKPMFLTLDSIAYSMIQEVTFNYRLLNSTIHIYTSNKVLDYNSWNHSQLRSILSFTQRAMREPSHQVPQTAVTIPAALPLAETAHPIIDQPLGSPTMSVPDEPDMDEIPTMPQPSHVFANENTESAYVTSSSINTMPLEPTNLNIGESATFAAPKFVERRYDRKYF